MEYQFVVYLIVIAVRCIVRYLFTGSNIGIHEVLVNTT